MKQLQKSDLKEGEIYKMNNNSRSYIFKATNNLKTVINITSYNMFFKIGIFNDSNGQFLEATPEEKHWLETCIKADKFVSYEEAIRTFIPEYYEYIGETNSYNTEFIKGKTYKIVNKNNLEVTFNFINEKGIANGWSGNNCKYFKPSTKEAYDAQFVVKEPKVVLEEPKDKVLTLFSNYGKESIVKVECSEGGVYRIGDKITVFDKYSPNKGKPFTIKSFRWTNDKSKICAVTELHTPNGIGLDKIELYVESKVKIVDDFVLPENWYIKVTDDNKEVLQQYIRNIHNLTMITLSNINYIAYSKWLYGINRTENKLGYGLISKLNLNLNPLPNIYRTVTYYNGEEITFEQFKKYVLKDE